MPISPAIGKHCLRLQGPGWRSSSTRVVWRATAASASGVGCIRSSAWWKTIGKRQGSDPIDKGRFDVTKDPDDLYVFRVASLRNVAKTPPYFHDGSVATLPEAVKVMARIQLGATLNDAETRDIVAFLESLTGELPANFATAPVLPPGAAAPAK